jgi:predicted MFS family arabinose efflux permease
MTSNKAAKTLGPPQDAVSETTPLLNASEGVVAEDSASIDSSNVTKSPQTPEPSSPTTSQPAEEEKPFPLNQILILCYASIVEPIAYFIIFPYMSEMVQRIGGQLAENVGFWAGTIESSFSLVQMLLTIFYGRLADRLGRKPVLVFSLAGIGVASALFGLSSTLWQMLVFRCLAGMFAGSSVTIRAMLSENSTKSTQAKAFGWFMFAR